MKHCSRLLAVAALLFVLLSCNKRPTKPRILVFSKTMGFRHSAIPNGKAAIIKLGKEHYFDVDTTEDAGYFCEDSLKKYSAVVFLSTTGNVLNQYQEAAFERYIQAGGGFVGVHAATDTEYDWGWYGRLVGGYFDSHPAQQEAKLMITDNTHISTKHLPKEWVRKDEWYNFKKLNPDVKVLITIDEKSYQGGKNGNVHPMAWYHAYDGGRAFYTELGHTEASYVEENFLKHLLGGIKYAIGNNDNLNYANAVTQPVPAEKLFTKTMLTQGALNEPVAMAILPNLDVLIAQRRGQLVLYKSQQRSIRPAGSIAVFSPADTTGKIKGDGLLGLTADPDFDNNHYVYLYYTAVDSVVNRLSRFTFENDSLNSGSEKIILQVPADRTANYNSGGALTFGTGHQLYLSTGDDTTPFDDTTQGINIQGFSPLDERPGHEGYDARRTAANTNDLRGKILRITINKDGTYEIPDGNLFATGTAQTRPEIYVMGCRNPYRISVDTKTGYLYWGDPGPAALKDSINTRGPRGYDEINQAKQAGFFGWPLFIGYNYPYRAYDYTTGTAGAFYNPAQPANTSRNNTGIQALPAAQPPLIWYGTDPSADFPQLGSSGRCAVAGPVYYTEQYKDTTGMPGYYNGKLFIYDKARGWIRAVTLQADGKFEKMEPFMENTRLHAPVDMQFGPDGKLYILEYGFGIFAPTTDASLSRIDYKPVTPAK